MLFARRFHKKFCRMCHAGDLQDLRHRTQLQVGCVRGREAAAARLEVKAKTMSSHSAKKTRAPRTPYVPPAARRSANAGNTSDNLSYQQDDSSIAKSRRPSAVGEEGARGLRGANEPGQRAGVVRASPIPGKGNSQRRAQGTCAEDKKVRPAATAATTTATTAPAVAPTTTAPGGASPRAAAPNGRPSAAKPTAKLSTPSATEKARPVNKRDERREQELGDDFQRRCSVKFAAGDTNTCHEPTALEATNTEASRASAAGTERARGEADPVIGKGRRKPRQAWSQYVPPKRRGSPSSASATEEAQPALRHPSTAGANAAAVRAENNINSALSVPNLGYTSPPPGDSCSTVGRDAESCPAFEMSGSTDKAISRDMTNDGPDLRGANGAIECEDPSTVEPHGTKAMIPTAVGADHQQQYDDRSAETERSVAESQQLKFFAEKAAAFSVAQSPSGLPAGHADATDSLQGRSNNDCCYGSVDVGASPNQRGAHEGEQEDPRGASEADTATSSPEISADSRPAALAEEAEVPPRPTPARSPRQASSSAGISDSGIGSVKGGGSSSGSSSSSTAARNRAPTSQAACDRQARTENAGGTTSGSEVETGHTPPELAGDASGGNAVAGENNGTEDSQELPVAKAPSARYVPPGRRKIIDAEVAACNKAGTSGTGTAGGVGPLWTSRAPIRVSQRARPSDREASPVRPSPARVAGVVSGGMSAYGANIAEYSGKLWWMVGVGGNVLVVKE